MAKSKQPAHIVGKLAEVALFFGVTEASIKTHWRPGMPDVCGKAGRWNLLEIGRWLVCEYYQQRSAPEGDIGQSMAKAKLRKLENDADLSGLKVKNEKRQRVPIEEMERACSQRDGYFVSVLQQIPPKIAPLVAGKSATQALKILRKHTKAIQRAVFGESRE